MNAHSASGMTGAPRRRMPRAAALLAGASIVALLAQAPAASAEDCPAEPPPADVASPASLYEQLRARTNAQLLSIGFRNKPVTDACTWIYEVRVLTASGSVVELDFAAASLDLIGARGPRNDSDAAALVRGLGADSTVLVTGPDTPTPRASSGPGSATDDGDDGGDDGSGEGGSGGDSSGEGGSGEGSDSGSGGGDSGEGGESGGDSSGSGSDGSGSEGGESGSGSSGSGSGGEGGDGGGDGGESGSD